jgi:hypothetical protein
MKESTSRKLTHKDYSDDLKSRYSRMIVVRAGFEKKMLTPLFLISGLNNVKEYCGRENSDLEMLMDFNFLNNMKFEKAVFGMS